jgi:hypothetical protein
MDKVPLDNAFAMWDTTCNFKASSDCDPHGYMTTQDIEHMEIFNTSNVRNMKIGFINIWGLNKIREHQNANEDHFELLITSLMEPTLFKRHDSAT